MSCGFAFIMPVFVTGIHDLGSGKEVADARDKREHDMGKRVVANWIANRTPMDMTRP
jgi:hypothetical protein